MKNVKTLTLTTLMLSAFAMSCAKDHHHHKHHHHHAKKTMASDGQISKVVTTVNNGEIELADYVMKNSQNEEVRGFAKHMVSDHSSNNQEVVKLVSKNDVSPEASKKSETFRLEGEASKSRLMKLKGAELDRAYISNQVATHEKVLNEINSHLIPSAQNKELKAHLRMTADKVEEHLNHAKEIQSNLL